MPYVIQKKDTKTFVKIRPHRLERVIHVKDLQEAEIYKTIGGAKNSLLGWWKENPNGKSTRYGVKGDYVFPDWVYDIKEVTIIMEIKE
jgi:hypothetical protein